MHALWLVKFANRISLYGPLIQGLFDFKSFPSIWTQRDKKNVFVFLIRAEIYRTEFFSTRISGPRASPLDLKSEPKKSFCNLQDGPRTRLVRGTYTA